MKTFAFSVEVEADDLEQAWQVMAERINHEEDYGFAYTVAVVDGPIEV